MHRPRALTLRPAGLQDAPTMAEMSRELIEGGLAWRYTPLRMAALIADPETMALVACERRHAPARRAGPAPEASRIQGFAVMHFGDVHAHLALLCVQPAQQRGGIGRRLHQWLVDSARVAGIASIRLELRADNAAALAFYRSLGFAETQLVPGYYEGRIAARRMSLPLHAARPRGADFI